MSCCISLNLYFTKIRRFWDFSVKSVKWNLQWLIFCPLGGIKTSTTLTYQPLSSYGLFWLIYTSSRHSLLFGAGDTATLSFGASAVANKHDTMRAKRLKQNADDEEWKSKTMSWKMLKKLCRSEGSCRARLLCGFVTMSDLWLIEKKSCDPLVIPINAALRPPLMAFDPAWKKYCLFFYHHGSAKDFKTTCLLCSRSSKIVTRKVYLVIHLLLQLLSFQKSKCLCK